MRKSTVWILCVCSTLILVPLAFALIIVPIASHKIEKFVQRKVHAQCAHCQVSIARTTLWWPSLSFHQVRITLGRKGGQYCEIKTPRVSLFPQLQTLLGGDLHFNEIVVETPEIFFYDGDQRTVENKTAGKSVAPKIDALEIEDGQFTYIRDTKGTHAVLTVHKIAAAMRLRPGELSAHAQMQVGHSGVSKLQVHARFGGRPLEIATKLQVEEQNLADLSRFFEPNAGVKLAGILLSGYALSDSIGDKLHATLWAQYRDFAIHVNKMYDRNELQTFFTNLGIAVAARSSNVENARPPKGESVDIKREQPESVVAFILRGLKEAALKVSL